MTQHSKYSFSSSHRWIEGACPASIRMSAGYPNLSNPAAEKGTAVHEMGELATALGINPDYLIGMTFNGIVADDKMVEGARLYRNVVDDYSLRYGVKPLLEQRVAMTSLGRDDVYGTSDCTIIAPQQRTLITADYKNGYGLVEVSDNSQTAGYSVATLDTFDLWDKVDTVINVIIQPNYDHIDGPVRHIVYSMNDMVEWREKFRRSVIMADDPNQRPVAGEHCHYCPAQANCRARLEYTLSKAYTLSPIDSISLGELEVLYKERNSVKKFIEKIEERMLAEARMGAQFKEFKLVESWPWAVVDDVKGLMAEAKELGIDTTQLYLDPKLIGKTRAAKILPPNLVKKYYRVPPPSTTIEHISNNRPAIRVGKATGVFAPITQPVSVSAAGVFSPIK